MKRSLLWAAVSVCCASAFAPATPAAANPTATIRNAKDVLAELIAIPVQRIPLRMLADAEGVAIIPRVLKVGFIAGVRRGQGVIMTRDADGEWGLPQFITLTGGSIGWQVGIQGTDVVLVFRTRTSVDRFMHGKFTIGVDAAAAAGPVGRNAAAATDAQLRAEILSYSRSRGLFAGVSLDGSVLELNQGAHTLFYGAPSTEPPLHIPESALALRRYLAELTPTASRAAAPVAEAAEAAEAPVVAATAAIELSGASRLEAIQVSLQANATALHAALGARVARVSGSSGAGRAGRWRTRPR